ncbi:guided entry of tail-anchored proteins factor 1 [Drosophila madeirensis]|uniref:Guided entry of tail-anchored proteins factor 1 n=1 Tax=Drosophila madeirensis TaxID=30013 RepID=A0AAU9FQQ4_DROMD|nr:guided entry of tail-anchored proteins factor 1 [Drosophila subobscura]
MELLPLIALLSLINTILPDFIRNYLKVSRFWKTSRAHTRQWQSEIDDAREELENVRNAEHAGEYAKAIKILRAERKLADAEAKLKSARSMDAFKEMGIDTVAYYVSKVLLALILIVVSILNRSTPVIVIDLGISLAPFTGLLSFPTGVYNAVSVPVWAFSCNVTFRLIYDMIMKRDA